MDEQYPDLRQIFEQATRHHRSGDLPRAEALYRQILSHQPDNADVRHMLGVLAYQAGHADAAVELLRRAIQINPRNSAYHTDLAMLLLAQDRLGDAIGVYRRTLELNPSQPESLSNLANALLRTGKLDEAVEACRKAVLLRPDYPEAFLNMGMALLKQLRCEEAVAAFRQALACRPEYAEAMNGLGSAIAQQGEHDEAILIFREAIGLRPDYRDAWNNLGNALRSIGRQQDAIVAFEHVLSRDPNDAEVLNNLGTALDGLWQYEQAIQAYNRAIVAKPDFSEAFFNLGNALQHRGELDEVIKAYRHAIALQPDSFAAHHNLGNVLRERGELDEAFALYRKGLAIRPDSRLTGGLLYSLHLDPNLGRRELYEEHRRWNTAFAQPLKHLIRPHNNDRSLHRRLKIGYVSPDLGNHAVGRFMVPLLGRHDHQYFEIFCYCDTNRTDAVLDRNRVSTDVWRQTRGMSDERLAELIRQDGIDILVDLSMHASENRLLVFARKPAPVQVTYLAYAGTTGLEMMDYRLTDPYLDPPGATEEFYSEESVRLPHTFWCYAQPPEAPQVAALPATASGRLTFGCLNNFGKVTRAILPAWIRVLRGMPDSRLLLHCKEGSHRDRFCERLESEGIDRGRIEFVGFVGIRSYMATYSRIDIALDTFPYAGGTTTCDTLWMGVPVVSLAGEPPHSRAGLSILSNVGLPELVAQDVDEYVRIAKQLAAHLPRLARLRSEMRARMLSSPLMNAPQFARDVEVAYRQMWQRWCESANRNA